MEKADRGKSYALESGNLDRTNSPAVPSELIAQQAGLEVAVSEMERAIRLTERLNVETQLKTTLFS